MKRLPRAFALSVLAGLLTFAALPGRAAEMDGEAKPRTPAIATRSGLDIHKRFRAHLAEPDCGNASARWRAHFAHAPKQLAARDDELLAVFGYVVDELIKAGLPTEYALIPFIESGYKPGARSGAGPAGLWQFIGITARNQGITIRPGYDGRYSVVDSTKAAVRYLKILHGMFGGNWRVAIMGYNAGEYRLIGAIKASGMAQRSADASRIRGVPNLTRAYVEKLHAISCLIEQADDRQSWLDAIDRPVPVLAAEIVKDGGDSLEAWARARGMDAGLLKRLNPALAGAPLRAGPQAPLLLAPVRTQADLAAAATPAAKADPAASATPATPRETPPAAAAASSPTAVAKPALASAADPAATPSTHTVAKGESWWSIARRYRMSIDELQRRNGLKSTTALRPGMVLKLDAGAR